MLTGLTHDQWKEKKAWEKTTENAALYGWNVRRDTVSAEVSYTKPKTELKISVDRNAPDTLVWKNADATLVRINTKDSTFYTVICDTVTVTDSVQIECPPVIEPAEPKIIEKQLTVWQELFLTLGKVFSGVLLLLFAYILFRIFKPKLPI